MAAFDREEGSDRLVVVSDREAAFGREEGKDRLVRKSDREACSTFLGKNQNLLFNIQSI